MSQPSPYPPPAAPVAAMPDPALAYLGHPAVQQAQLAITACRCCGSVPAVPVRFRGHRGMVVVMQFLRTDGPFCRDCGLAVFRRMTSHTLVQGWYGYASVVITP